MHTTTANTYEWNAAAKILGEGPNVLRKKLVEADVFIPGKKNPDYVPPLPHSRYVQQGYFVLSQGTYKTGPVVNWCIKVQITAAGLAFVREKLYELEQRNAQQQAANQ